jgi:hypothetical protein
MNCQRARRLLSERLDHPLSLRTSAALCEHLADCVECTGYDERLQVRMTDISRLSALAPLPRRAYVSVQMTEPARARSFGRRLASGAAWSGGVLALLLVAAIAFSLWQPGRLPDAPPTIAASSAPAPLSIIAAPPMPDERPANTPGAGPDATAVYAGQRRRHLGSDRPHSWREYADHSAADLSTPRRFGSARAGE